jgi:hypothetical protein
MKMNALLLCATVALSWTIAPISAHHPVAPTYVHDRTQTVEGNLVEFVLRNPHSLIYLDTPGEKGEGTRWTIEWLAKVQLNRQGVSSETLKLGDHLVISGLPAQNAQDHRLWLRTITRPNDGWKWRGAFE